MSGDGKQAVTEWLICTLHFKIKIAAASIVPGHGLERRRLVARRTSCESTEIARAWSWFGTKTACGLSHQLWTDRDRSSHRALRGKSLFRLPGIMSDSASRALFLPGSHQARFYQRHSCCCRISDKWYVCLIEEGPTKHAQKLPWPPQALFVAC